MARRDALPNSRTRDIPKLQPDGRVLIPLELFAVKVHADGRFVVRRERIEHDFFAKGCFPGVDLTKHAPLNLGATQPPRLGEVSYVPRERRQVVFSAPVTPY